MAPKTITSALDNTSICFVIVKSMFSSSVEADLLSVLIQITTLAIVIESKFNVFDNLNI